MPSITFVQARSTTAGSGSFTGGVLSLAYSSNNTAGNVGIVATAAGSGSVGASITDTNSNTWRAVVGTNQLGGNVTLWICLNLAGGPNTVSVSGLTGYQGGPSMVILEYSTPANTGVTAFQPPFNAFLNPLNLDSNFLAPGHTFQQVLIAAVYDTNPDSYTWSVNGGANLRGSTLESGGRSLAVADQSVTVTTNHITFTPSGGSYTTAIVGLTLWVTS